jgi:hypothetical protein
MQRNSSIITRIEGVCWGNLREGKKQLARRRSAWENKSKMGVKEIRWGGGRELD